MRIAFMLTSLGIGGTERQVVALAERMRARGHVVLILVLLPPLAEQWTTSVRVVHLNLKKTPVGAVTGMARAVRVLREFRTDILHCHNFHGNLLGRLLKLALPGVRVVSTIHNVYEGGRLRMSAYRLTDGLSRRTIAVCAAAASRMIALGAVPANKCSVIVNGINAATFAPGRERRTRVRLEMGAGDEFVWMTTGRIVAAKSYENLLCAFAIVRAEARHGVLWVAGDGKGEYAERIRLLGTLLGLDGAIRWLGVRREVAALLDAADAFVLASAWEGMPLALGEAMAMAKPIVATDVGGVRELLADCGVVVTPCNARALASSMMGVMRGTPAVRARSGEAARRRIVENFSMDSSADAWESTYRAVLAPRS